jgi:hypothetical protein
VEKWLKFSLKGIINSILSLHTDTFMKCHNRNDAQRLILLETCAREGIIRAIMKKGYSVAFTVILLLFSLAPKSGHASTSYYSIIASGGGYRDFILDEPTYNKIFISPYFEFGSSVRGKRLFGFNGMIVLNPENTSEITLYQIGGQVKFFIVPRTFFIGGGPAINVEGKNVKGKDRNASDSGVTIENPKVFFNINLHMGFALPLFKGYSIIFDTFVSQSLGNPYPYSVNLMLGILSVW